MSPDVYTWKISNFVMNAEKQSERSPAFCRDGHNIYLKAVKSGGDLYFHVKLVTRDIPTNIGVRLTRMITLLNRKDPNLNIVRPRNCDMAHLYLSSMQTWWGCNFIGLEKVMDVEQGFISEDGAIAVEVEFYPVTSVKWQIPSFRKLTREVQSPVFSVGGSDWQLVVHPKDGQRTPKKHMTHVSGYFRSVAVNRSPSLSLRATFTIACLDQKGNRKFDFTREDCVFGAENDKAGTYQFIPLSALRCSSPWLQEGSLQMVAETLVTAVVWKIDWTERTKVRESDPFSIGACTWKAIAIAWGDNKVIFAVTSLDDAAFQGDFIVRPEFQIVVAGTTIDADSRFEFDGRSYWGARMESPVVGTNSEVTFSLPHKPRSVSWMIRNFRSFLNGPWFPKPVKSGKFSIGNDNVEVTIHPHGTGEGHFTHLSVFITLIRIGQKRISRSLDITFTVTGDASSKYSGSFTLEGNETDPLGMPKFMPIEQIEKFLQKDGSLRLDATWSKPIPALDTLGPAREGEDVDTLQLFFGAQREMQRVKHNRDRPMTDFEKAVKIIAMCQSTLASWDVPTNVTACMQNAQSRWEYLKRTQEEVRQRVVGALPTSAAATTRDDARQSFCDAIVELKGLRELDNLDELHNREVQILPALEEEYPRQNIDISRSVIREVHNAAQCWLEWKEDWDVRCKAAATATDNATRTIKESVRRLFDVESTFVCDEVAVRGYYHAALDRLREEDILLNEKHPVYHVAPVIMMYYSLKDKMMLQKKGVQCLWNLKEELMSHYESVHVWLERSPNLLTLTKIEKKRSHLTCCRRKLNEEQISLKAEKDPYRVAATKKRIEDEISSMNLAVRKLEDGYMEEYYSLCDIRDSHFPELKVPVLTSIYATKPVRNEASGGYSNPQKQTQDVHAQASHMINSLLRDKKSLDQYHDRNWICERIMQATLWGDMCALKKFTSQDALLREARLLWQLRHPSIVQLQSVFYDAEGGYIQTPLYRRDLATWLCQNGHIGLEIVLNLISSIVGTVAHVHQCGIVHGNLHPRHFLMDSQLRLVLCDFGSAVQNNDDSTFVCRGTRGYIAPELLRFGATPTKASDMYSVGCIIQKDLLPRCKEYSMKLEEAAEAAESMCSRVADGRPMAIDVLADMIVCREKPSYDMRGDSMACSMASTMATPEAKKFVMSPPCRKLRSEEPEEEPRM